LNHCKSGARVTDAKTIGMSLQSAPDIPLTITVSGPSPTSPPLLSAERRISPSWTIRQLKAKLEPVTGIPPSAQRLRTRGFDGNWIAMEGEEMLVSDREWSAGVRRGGEIEVSTKLSCPLFSSLFWLWSENCRVFALQASLSSSSGKVIMALPTHLPERLQVKILAH
jgi:hypothetical protein